LLLIFSFLSGRWRESNLAKLIGEEPVETDAVEAPIQALEMAPIAKQPFSSMHYIKNGEQNGDAEP
jgi:solute carrier family 44 protein 1 (choline transporter-like protein)